MSKMDWRNSIKLGSVGIIAVVAVAVGGLTYASHQIHFKVHHQIGGLLMGPNSIQSIDLFSGAGAAIQYHPKSKSVIQSEVLRWLRSGVVTQVDIPLYTPVQSQGVGIVGINMITSEGHSVEITPAHYFGQVQPGYTKMHYFPNILEYRDGDTLTYFKSPQMYQWLMDGWWQHQFTYK